MNLVILGKIYVIGLAILIGAIVINVLAYYLSLPTWYDFLKLVTSQGLVGALSSLSVFAFIFLFIIYPFLLGLLAYGMYKII